jgi:serine/threonine protein kinase
MKKSEFWKSDWFLGVGETLRVTAAPCTEIVQDLERKVDAASDLFLLGVTVYHPVSGHLPYAGDSMAQLMYRIANGAHADRRQCNPNLPACVDAIGNKALAKDPVQRYQSCDQMAKALRLCLSSLRVQNKFTAEAARA